MAYSRTRNQIINSAIKNVRLLAFGQNPPDDLVAECSRRLNDIIKSYQIASHIKLWKDDWATQTLTESSAVIGSDGNNYRCVKGHTSSADNEPITGADWSTYWILDEGVTGVAWVTATAYTTIAEFSPGVDTLQIKDAFYRDTNGYDYKLKVVTLQEYFEISDKRWVSDPCILAFHEALTPICYLYPHPRETTFVIHYLREKALIDFTGIASTPDFPDRWIYALIWALSADLSSYAGLSITERRYLDTKAELIIKSAASGEFNGLSIGQVDSYFPGGRQ